MSDWNSKNKDFIKAFQRKHSLVVDGLAGVKTYAALGIPTATAIESTIYVIAGHGGADPGAVSGDLKEHDLTYAFADELRAALIRYGLSPERIYRDPKSHKTLDSLAVLRKEVRPDDIVVDVHFNWASSPSANGFECLVADAHSKKELRIATSLAKVAERYGFKLRGNTKGNAGVKTESESKRGKLPMLNLKCTCVLVEVGFITSPLDISLYRSNFKALADAYALALLSHV